MAEVQEAKIQVLSDVQNVLEGLQSIADKVAEIRQAKEGLNSSNLSYDNSASISAINNEISSVKSLVSEYSDLKSTIGNMPTMQATTMPSLSVEGNAASSFADLTRQARDASSEMFSYTNSLTNFEKQIDGMSSGTINNLRQQAKMIKDMTSNNSKPFDSYKKGLDDLERQATVLYHSLHDGSVTDVKDKVDMQKQLDNLIKKYGDLNRESVNFRKEVGVQSSRGFYDLNHNLDYFEAKLRSKIAMMAAEWFRDLAIRAPQQLVDSISKLEQAKVNFAQVMPDSFGNDQQAMNKAMDEFIGIAQQYGQSLDDITEAARLWGRQYKDVAVVQQLVNSSTKLSITDNMSLTEVNKALEATMQQYNISLKDANEAQLVSNKIVDSWANLADTAVVTASDLAAANERSAGAAYQAGISFDYLQGMIATMSAATGRAGGEVGRSIRSMIVSMQSAKGQQALKEIGVEATELDANGVRHLRNFEKVITEVMQKVKDSDKDLTNVMLALSGGKQNCPPIQECIGNSRFYIG